MYVSPHIAVSYIRVQVTWDSEKECFTTFAKELADFYAVRKNHYAEVTASQQSEGEGSSQGQTQANKWQWTVEHVIFPAFRSLLMPPKSASEDTSVLQLADLPDLYKVFERC
jgi:DNA mismatch repair protein MLH1